MKIGIILTGFGMQEYVRPCLDAWIAARDSTVRAQKLGGNTFLICAVSLPFAGFPNDGEDQTTDLLRAELAAGHIDYLITEPRNIPETTARSMALTWLAAQGCTLYWQVDVDEMYEIDQIARIVRFTEENPWIISFSLSLRNYVFNTSTYLIERFCPSRIHRDMCGLSCAHHFYQDNNIAYHRDTGGGQVIETYDAELPRLTISPMIADIRHLSWLSDLRSKKKVEYQTLRWGAKCSFAWDDTKGLIFNPALPAPQIARDE